MFRAMGASSQRSQLWEALQTRLFVGPKGSKGAFIAECRVSIEGTLTMI